jgi:hypothetical protein
MALDFNIEPFYDDYSEDKKFYRILFRPGYAVQARELTQLQTIIQQQIKRQGDHLFKNGAMVIPGQIGYDTNTPYVSLEATLSASDLKTFTVLSNITGKTYRGQTSGVEAVILTSLAATATSSEPDTLFVKYIKGSTEDAETTGRFKIGEILSPVDGTLGEDLVVGQNVVTGSTTRFALGTGTTATIEKGVYYVKDNFVLVDQQTVVISKYSSVPSAKIGLKVIEEVRYPEDDESLLDNALGSPNYAAPGAARYYINLVLSSLDVTTVVDPYDFIPLLVLENGQVQFLINKTEYAQLEKTLARRTFDESGDYSVRPFPIQIKEKRNNYRGAWAFSQAYIRGDIVLVNNTTTYKCITDHISASSGVFSIGLNWLEDSSPRVNFGKDLGPNTIAGAIELTDELSLAIEPGKAYVRGYEIEKVATQYLTLNKSRAFPTTKETIAIDTSPGNYVIIESANYLPDINTFTVLDLYNKYSTAGTNTGTKVGTAKAYQIQYHDTVNSVARYKLFLFDIQMIGTYNFARDAKWIYSATGGAPATRFTAQIAQNLTELPGLISTAVHVSSLTTITSTDSTYLADLKDGDYVNIGGSAFRVNSRTSNNIIVVDGDASAFNASRNKVFRVGTLINDPSRLTPMFALPRYAIKSTANVKYQFYRSASVTGSSVNQVVYNPGYKLESAGDDRNYIMVNNATGAHLKLSSGSTGNPAVGFFEVFGVGTDTGTFVVNSASTGAYTVIYCLSPAEGSSSASTPRNKQLTVVTETLTLTAGKVSLNRTDIFELVSITAAGVNVTSKFTFDNGQRNSYYAFGSISTTEASLQSSQVVVKYQYFSHATSGNFFSVDSYTHATSNIEFEEVSRFQSGCIDFRPAVIPNSPFWATPVIPKYGELTTVSYDYYYGRIDKLSIDYTGSYILTEGTPSADPLAPKSPDNAMDLFVFNIEPYTYTANYGVKIQKIENKRYTMRDIGKIEGRIKNLEYYASLSNLEQNTANLKSYDSYGLERPQNGFLVDGFNGQGVGNASSLDWKASIDTVNSELRPFTTLNQINLLEIIDSGISRSNKGYEVNGDILTLKIQEKLPLVKQLRASHFESVNPFDLYTYKGDLAIIPWSDTWFETQRRPDVIINDNSQYDAVVAKAERDGVLGTIFGAWQTVWSGVTSATNDTFSADRRGGDGGAFLDATFGRVESGSGWAARTVTVATSTDTTVQSRTNIVTSIQSRTDYTTISDKIVATDLIPFMRSRRVVFRGAAFKPTTRLYPFFDDADVSAYIKPSKRIVVFPKTIGAAMPEFTMDSNVGTAINSAARKINDVVATAYSYGEVLIECTNAGTPTGKTMVVVGQESPVIAGSVRYLLYVENIRNAAGAETTPSDSATHYWKGEFDETKQVRFDSASVYSSTGLGAGTASTTILNSSYTGQVFGTFDIPNNNAVKFRTGTRLFRLTDSQTNIRKDELTSGEAYFESRGILETYEKTVLATRTASVVSEQVTENRSLINTSDRVVSDTGWYDPLAQTFLVDVPGGVFLTDVDLYFAQKPSSKDPEVPVRIEIRNVVNGYPGQVILPYSRVSLPPSKVNVDVLKGTAVTNFKFTSPLFLQSGVEYCVCIFSDSSKYKVWVSQAGEVDVNGSGVIATQPYAGVLFKSQNASTWTADQSQDLKFQLNRAKFTVGNSSAQSATLNMVNQHVTSAIPYAIAQVDINNVVMSDTSIRTQFKANVADAYQTIELGNSILFDTPKTVATATVEAGIPSMYAEVILSTKKENISPIIDLSRCTATLIHNIIENTTSVTNDYENLDSLGIASAKYVTKAITLNDPASTIRILYNANIPNAAKVDVYYKVGDSGSNNFDEAEYKLITNGGTNISTFKEVIKSENRRQFGEAEYLIENLTPFTTLKIKLVMKSSNAAKVPRIKDLRVIAYA